MSERALDNPSGALRPRRGPAAGVPPFISVIVPVRNEGAFIGDTLEQVLNQHYHPERFEVLVADGGSTDDTRAVVAAMQREYPNLRLLANPGRWSSAGRNVAIRAARWFNSTSSQASNDSSNNPTVSNTARRYAMATLCGGTNPSASL